MISAMNSFGKTLALTLASTFSFRQGGKGGFDLGYLFKAKAEALKSLKDKIVSGFDAVKGSILAWKGDLLRSKGYELISKGQSLLDFGAGLKKPKGNKGGYPAPGESLSCRPSFCELWLRRFIPVTSHEIRSLRPIFFQSPSTALPQPPTDLLSPFTTPPRLLRLPRLPRPPSTPTRLPRLPSTPMRLPRLPRLPSTPTRLPSSTTSVTPSLRISSMPPLPPTVPQQSPSQLPFLLTAPLLSPSQLPLPPTASLQCHRPPSPSRHRLPPTLLPSQLLLHPATALPQKVCIPITAAAAATSRGCPSPCPSWCP